VPLVSLVIPCYNEAASLPVLFARCADVLSGSEIEVVFVDNGSTDHSAKVFQELLPSHPFARSVKVAVNGGYGLGILTGLQAATGQFLGWTHADLQTDPGDVLRAVDIIKRAPDPTNLFIKGRRVERPFMDQVFTVGMAVFETVLLRQRMWDINAQPTVFSRRFYTAWTRPPHDFSLDLFAYYQARKMNLRVVRFSVRFCKRLHGTSHWNVDWASKRKFIRRTIDYTLRLRRELLAKP